MLRFLLLGVAGAVLKSSRLVFDEPRVPGFRDGAVRIVPSLPSRLAPLREEANDRVRAVIGVEVEDISSSESLGASISRLARISGVNGFMERRSSANRFISSRKCISLIGRAENRACSYEARNSVAVEGDVMTPTLVRWPM